MGKVATRIEITGEEGGPVEIAPWMPGSAIDVGIIEGELVSGEQA